MTRKVLRRTLIGGLASMVSMGAASVAVADTVQFEAESVRIEFPLRGSITSPLMIKDDPAASGGSYVMVAAGYNSSTTAPASTTEGVAKYTFSVADTGTYRIWARVSTPTNADDSFWIRIGKTSSWINWNGMTLGSAFHWVQVKADGASSASTFNLTAGVDNELQVAYREDGTKLDAFYITSSTTFNPTATLTGPPAPPVMQPAANGGGSVKISWSAVPGATSYTLEREPSGCSFNTATQCCEPATPYAVIAKGLTVHKFTDVGGGGKYRVTAVGSKGSSLHPVSVGPDHCFPLDPSEGTADNSPYKWRAQLPVGSLTSPMGSFIDINGGVGAPAGTNSTSAVPTHGRMRMDFELAASAPIRMWAEIMAPNKSQDSFWVRWDDGTWINWNDLATSTTETFFCSQLHDSSKSGSPVVLTTLGAGSHRLEFAYREGGARLADNIIILQDVPSDPSTQGEQCSD
jgi:hypothetical protein